MSESSNNASYTLDPADVELANAYGPYSHGTWVGPTVSVGNEEALAGRGQYLASQIRAEILNRYRPDQIRNMIIVDVGCYDGWLLCQLADLPFRRMVGIEPREKNIEKGRTIRKLLGIETRCEFRKGSIETLDEVLCGEKANVVVCAGLIHHLPSTADGVSRLHAICSDFLFLETICLPPKFQNDRLRESLELKDLPYFFGKPIFGMTGHKLESGYYDGSAVRMSVVSLPSIEALRMFLDVQGFINVRVVANPDAYSKAVHGGWRQFSAVCITAEVDPHRDTSDETAAWVAEYEGGLMCTMLPDALVRYLFQRFCLNERTLTSSWLALVVASSISTMGWGLAFSNFILRISVHERFALEILRNLRYAPQDKISLEFGKSLMARGLYAEAEQALFRITRRMNADWRAVYRAFCLLVWSFRQRGDIAGAARYEELCRIANPLFPTALLRGSPASLRKSRSV